MALNAGGPADFTDGDTCKRVTITDPSCRPSSRVLVGIMRTDVADDDDGGWVFVANVVTRAAGSFDVVVCALVLGEPALNDEGPNEVVDLVYAIE